MSFTDHIANGYRRRFDELRASNNPLADGIACVDGEYLPVYEARIPLLDQGFLKSDLTYDVPAIWDGRFFRLDDHLDRLERGCELLRLKSPMPREEIKNRLVEMAALSGIRDGYVMIVVTRGLRYLRQYAPEDCTNFCYLMLTPYVWVMDLEMQKAGGQAIIARTVRRTPPGAIDPTVKNLQWGDFTRGLLEARDRGAVYPILTDGDTNITEGSGFNVMLVKDRKIYTPRKGVLEGVTRKTVMELAEQLGFPCTVDDVPVQMVYDCDELFMVTTAGGVMPITYLDGKPIGDGKVGPITQTLWKAYWDAHYDPALSFAIDYR
ncbi:MULTISPECIES: aminotransferase class IV [Mesorhizobium]|uniref:Probable branched-chain-amino-acid aminotransferase n=1 Tax=Mesorhizobium denitrificans TaxID=2294114 RepID=A0A371XI78_9HYPH|nr:MULTISPECIES: aminotransferase class IV [Mesorhizobium]RFC68919.1 class IV aminotransferase [Mesorhizobium denitrificans]